MSASELAANLKAIGAAAERRPLDFMRWLPAQLEFLKAKEKRVLLRTGNQLGKTTAGCAELLWRMEGRHPFKEVRPAPVFGIVLCATHEQTLAIQKKLWDLVDRSLLAEGCVYDAKKGGLVGKYPRLRMTNGSEVIFRSGRGESLNLAGHTADFLWVDEPPTSARVFSEGQKRVLRTNGSVFLTLTPVNSDVRWLKDAVEAGAIRDIHTRMTPEALIPVGSTRPIRLSDGTPASAEWIEQIEKETLPWERDVVVHGGWEFRSESRVFESFDRDKMITRQTPAGDVPIYLGIDHGSGRLGSSFAAVVAVESLPGEEYPRIYVLSEYSSGDLTTEDHDAFGILESLDRIGIRYSDLSGASGDVPHFGSNKKNPLAKKSNALLSAALGKCPLAARHGIGPGLVDPPIINAKKGRGPGSPGAVAFGATWLHRVMIRDRFFVHPRCVNIIEAISRYDLKANTKSAHAIDSIRYALRTIIYASVQGSRSRARITIR